ncbi:Ig-like domain-containing protein [Listeria sp. ILCC792]|uniref:Ig-like domain-containing protein n=1 Tax=Listeria sp. ILCC792 TaxID=1918331 RepID=UPI000B592524|nr:Ig-like domain-containing protein [Listeria sp. ILCC792]
MKIKKSKLKKIALSTVAATVFASTIATSIPFNVVTADAANAGVNNLKANLEAGSGNLVDASFSSKLKWYPIYWIGVPNTGNLTRPGWGTSQDGWEYTWNNDNYAAKFSGNGIGQIRANQTQPYATSFGIGQGFDTVAGHNYRIQYRVTPTGGTGKVEVAVNNGDNYFPNVTDRDALYSHHNSPYGFANADGQLTTGTFTALSDKSHVMFETTNGTIQMSDFSIVDLDAEIAPTTINALTTDSVKAEGTAEPNAKIVFKDQNNNQIASGDVAANGTYSVTIPKQAAGTVVTATATAENDKTASANTTVTQGNIARTVINPLTTDSIKAEGTAEPGASIVFKDQNNNQIATGTVTASGTYSVTIPKQVVGTTVTATATATKGGKTESDSTIVTQGNLVQTTIGALTTNSTLAEGTAQPNADITIKVGGNTIATGRVSADGNYSLGIPKQAVGTIVTATATLAGKTSSANTTVTQGAIAQTIINSLTTDSIKAEGTAEPNAAIVIKDQNNNQLANGQVASDGTYSLTI